MSAARPGQQPAGSAPAAKPITEAWRLDNGTCALYTQDPAAKDLAAKARLRPMAAYYRPDADGAPRLIAWQFAGPREKVMRVLAEAKRLEETSASPKGKEAVEKQAADAGTAYGLCASCGQPFAVRGRRQKYCRACALEAERRRKREWWAAKSGKVSQGAGSQH